MRYYLLMPSGERYGPADVPTLNQWAADRRLQPSSKLMDEMSGSVVQASTVAGLVFPAAAPPPPSSYGPIAPPAPGTIYRPSASPGHPHAQIGVASDSGLKDLLASFGIAVIAPLIGFVTIYGVFVAIGGIQFGWRAMQKGQKLGILAIVLNVLAVGGALYMRFVLRWNVTHRY